MLKHQIEGDSELQQVLRGDSLHLGRTQGWYGGILGMKPVKHGALHRRCTANQRASQPIAELHKSDYFAKVGRPQELAELLAKEKSADKYSVMFI